jgi:hypothetical protein
MPWRLTPHHEDLTIVNVRRILPFALICLAAVALAAATLCGPLNAADLPIRYNMIVDVDYDNALLDVTQIVQVPNRGITPVTSIAFNVPPIAFQAFTLLSAAVGAGDVDAKLDGVMLDLPLSQPLASGESVSVTLRWRGRLPPSNGRYGATDGVLVLGDWYPSLAVLDNGQWLRHQYTPIGDAFFADVADYDVTLNVPANAVVASGAGAMSRTEGKWVLRAENVRDVAFGVSSRFQTVSRKVENVAITVYYFGERAEAARTALDIADQSLRWYVKKLGPYPFTSLAIVQTAGEEHSAQEHSGIFFVKSSYFTAASVGIYVAHELAHGWFFASVGNDQIREPWLDEALVTSISLDFYRETRTREFPALWKVWGAEDIDVTKLPPLNKAISEFKAGEGSYYFSVVYKQGAAFWKDVREAMGDDAYWKALRSYVETYAGQVAEPRDLLRMLRQGAPSANLLPIFRLYLDYAYLAYADLAVEIAGTDGQALDGQVLVPITVTAASPTYTLSILLDSQIVTTTNRSLTVPVDTTSLANGQHELRVIADDGGLNRVEARRTFRVARPTPTPTPTATRPPTATVAPGATRTPAPTATIAVAAPASPLGSPTPATPAPAPAVRDDRLTTLLVGLIGATVLVAAALVWTRLHRRRRW